MGDRFLCAADNRAASRGDRRTSPQVTGQTTADIGVLSVEQLWTCPVPDAPTAAHQSRQVLGASFRSDVPRPPEPHHLPSEHERGSDDHKSPGPKPADRGSRLHEAPSCHNEGRNVLMKRESGVTDAALATGTGYGSHDDNDRGGTCRERVCPASVPPLDQAPCAGPARGTRPARAVGTRPVAAPGQSAHREDRAS